MNDNVTNSVSKPSTLVRARFGPGMLLQHEDLEQLSAYTRDLSRLLFRSFFGCGVVCGLEVKPEDVCNKPGVTISAGLALDCNGDPIYLPKDQSLEIDGGCMEDIGKELWVILCRTTKCCSPRPSVCPSDDDEAPPVCTRERDFFEIRIVKDPPPKCICSCKPHEDSTNDWQCADPQNPCYEKHYAGECGCDLGAECDCCCDCVVLAYLENNNGWEVDYSYRRFIRPVLMRDPLPRSDLYQRKGTQKAKAQMAKSRKPAKK